MTSRVVVAAIMISALACAPGEKRGDTTVALPAVDTLKPAPMDSTDTTRAGAKTATASTKQPVGARTGTTRPPVILGPTGAQKTTPRRDSILGRDSVIKMDPRDPRRQLPKVKPDSVRPPR